MEIEWDSMNLWNYNLTVLKFNGHGKKNANRQGMMMTMVMMMMMTMMMTMIMRW